LSYRNSVYCSLTYPEEANKEPDHFLQRTPFKVCRFDVIKEAAIKIKVDVLTFGSIFFIKGIPTAIKIVWDFLFLEERMST
jgi:hypothetical protein